MAEGFDWGGTADTALDWLDWYYRRKDAKEPPKFFEVPQTEQQKQLYELYMKNLSYDSPTRKSLYPYLTDQINNFIGRQFNSPGTITNANQLQQGYSAYQRAGVTGARPNLQLPSMGGGAGQLPPGNRTTPPIDAPDVSLDQVRPFTDVPNPPELEQGGTDAFNLWLSDASRAMATNSLGGAPDPSTPDGMGFWTGVWNAIQSGAAKLDSMGLDKVAAAIAGQYAVPVWLIIKGLSYLQSRGTGGDALKDPGGNP